MAGERQRDAMRESGGIPLAFRLTPAADAPAHRSILAAPCDVPADEREQKEEGGRERRAIA
jgi:hypothetical protein